MTSGSGAGRISLPDRANFSFKGTHFNAAFTHPMCRRSRETASDYLRARAEATSRVWPYDNPRDEAVAAYAALINAAPAEIAVVASTMAGENMLALALGLGPASGVVTDDLHFEASLAMYAMLHKQHDMPLTVVKATDNRIDYDRLNAAITGTTRLVALSLVSSASGFMHDLKTVCDIAHRKGALVYADIIQAAGAVPFDVRECGVDFCCTAMYKWLMGDAGAAFLYVRADRLPLLQRFQLGWRSMRNWSPNPADREWDLGSDTASLFEAGAASWPSLASGIGAMSYIRDLGGVERLAAHRQPMLDRLRRELPRHGYEAITPEDAAGPSITFARPGARQLLTDRLLARDMHIAVYDNGIRISPSVHNDMDQLDDLMVALAI